MQKTPLHVLGTAGVAVALLLFQGCGGKSGPKHWPITGKVTYKGNPVADAAAQFSNPDAGIDITANLGADGTFSIATIRGPGLPEGVYRVAIVAVVNKKPEGIMLGPQAPAPKRPDIPMRYRDTSTSGLSLTVKPEANTFDVDMRP